MSVQLTFSSVAIVPDDFVTIKALLEKTPKKQGVRFQIGNTMEIGVVDANRSLFCVVTTVGMNDYLEVIHTLITHGYADTHRAADVDGFRLDLVFCPQRNLLSWLN